MKQWDIFGSRHKYIGDELSVFYPDCWIPVIIFNLFKWGLHFVQVEFACHEKCVMELFTPHDSLCFTTMMHIGSDISGEE